MKLLALSIDGFRGIRHTDIRFGNHDVLIAPNGSGKSTIIDAMSLVFGRTRLVRDLTEHDFYGSRPEATSRIRIIATLGGFRENDPAKYDGWFRDGRAIPKWWDPQRGKAEPEPRSNEWELCAQIAFAARFDLEELTIEQIRYFHDDDTIEDPFLDDVVQQVPIRLFDEIGYYVLPAKRTWEAAATFASELFRKAVATLGGIPAQTVLCERDRLRNPQEPLEDDAGLRPLVERINEQLAKLFPVAPQFQLRVTATDSDSLLRALIPHFKAVDGISLPVGRHGMGLLSLQTFILLLELGRERRNSGKPFLLAMEEPELHIPPGMQRRLVSNAVSIAEQTICTSHSPRVAAFFPATSVQVLDHRPTEMTSTPLLERPLNATSSNAMRKLCYDDRPRFIEALMHHSVIIPEGRTEYEWFRLLNNVLETGEKALEVVDSGTPSFGTVIGIVPTHDSAVEETFKTLFRLRGGLVPLVDGDAAGSAKVAALSELTPSPRIILQWQDAWTIEDAIGWVLKGSEDDIVGDLKSRIEHEFESIDELVALFKVKTGRARLKGDYLAYEEVASVICNYDGCRSRADKLLRAITNVCLKYPDKDHLIVRDDRSSTEKCAVFRLSP